ncbi:hypothetical protein Tco_1455093, partial [Tanacetum coccineum]
MSHLVSNITLNSARSCVMQSAFFTQVTVSSIFIIFSWGGSISPEGFLSSVLLWLVIIVAVVGVTVVVVENYPIWEVIQRVNGPVSVSTDTNGVLKVLPPKTAEEILARERERKARTILLMALPEDHLAKFHKMTDAREMWEAIKSRFCGNDESKKMQKVFESDVKGSTASSSSTQSVAFVSENTSSTNDVSTAYGVSNSFGHKSQCENPSSYSFLANQFSCPQLDHEDLEQLDEFDLEEMDLKWQVAMISMRMKKFYKKTGRKMQFDAKELVGFDKTKVECSIVTRQGILLESEDPRGIKIVGGEMLGTLGIKIKTMGGDL